MVSNCGAQQAFNKIKLFAAQVAPSPVSKKQPQLCKVFTALSVTLDNKEMNKIAKISMVT